MKQTGLTCWSACIRITGLVAALCVAAGPLPPQNREQPPQFRVAVNLVTVDAVVTDKKGGFPTDLRAADFQVFEDGVRQQIQGFEIVQARSTDPASATQPAVRSTSPVFQQDTLAGVAASSPADRRMFLLVLDNLNSRWSSLSQVRNALEKFISESLTPQDLVAVVTVSHSTRLVQNFTNERPALLTAVRSVLARAFQGDIPLDERERAVEEAHQETDAPEWRGQTVNLDAPEVARRETAKILSLQNDYSARNALFTLKSLCEALSGVRGRKVLVYVSEGFGATAPAQSILAATVNAANRTNVSIYTIDPRGLESVDPSQTVSLSQMPRERTLASTGIVTAGNTDFDLKRLEAHMNSKDDGLSTLSTGTGGLRFFHSNAYREFLDLVHRENHYYFQLTYAPVNQTMDGKYRRIDVKLLRSGYKLRARPGYYATDSPAGLVGTVEDQMYQALHSPRRIQQLITAISPAMFFDPNGGGIAQVALKLNPENTTLSREGDHQIARFQLLAGVFDDGGKLLQDYRQDYRLVLDIQKLQRFEQEGASVSLAFHLPPGKYQVKTVVRESETGRMGIQREDLEIARYSGGTPFLSSLVLTDHLPSRAETSAKSRGSKEEYDPFLFGSSVVTPSAARQFPPEGSLYVFFHAYNIADPAERSRTSYRYNVWLFRDQAVVARWPNLPVQTAVPHPLGGFLVSSRLPLSAMALGTYRLEVELAGPDESKRTSRSITFDVRIRPPQVQRRPGTRVIAGPEQ